MGFTFGLKYLIVFTMPFNSYICNFVQKFETLFVRIFLLSVTFFENKKKSLVKYGNIVVDCA